MSSAGARRVSRRFCYDARRERRGGAPSGAKRRSAARSLDVGLELFVGQRAVLVGISGLEILEQGVHFLLQRQSAVMLDVGRLERLRTGFRQLVGGQVTLVLLVAKVEALHDRLPKLLAIESAVAVFVGGLEARAEIRWHRAGLGGDACSTDGQGKSSRRQKKRSTSQAHRGPPCPAEFRGSASRRSSSFRRADDRRCRRSSRACRQWLRSAGTLGSSCRWTRTCGPA